MLGNLERKEQFEVRLEQSSGQESIKYPVVSNSEKSLESNMTL